MATEHIVTVKSSGGDFTTINLATNNYRCDLTTLYVANYDNPSTTVNSTNYPNRGAATWSGGTGTMYHISTTAMSGADAFTLEVLTGTVPADNDTITVNSNTFDVAGTPQQGVQLTFEQNVVGDTSSIASTSSDWQTSDTCYIKFTTTSDLRHEGKWDVSKPYFDASFRPYYFGHFKIEGVQWTCTDPATATLQLDNPTGSVDCWAYVENSIIRAVGTSGSRALQTSNATSGVTYKVYLSNCVFDSSGDNNYCVHLRSASGNPCYSYMYNCTVRNSGAQGMRVDGATHGYIYMKNVIIYNSTGNDWDGRATYELVLDHVLTSDGTILDSDTNSGIVVVASGDCDATVADTLQDADGDFSNVMVGMTVKNTTDTTYANITAIYDGYCSVDSDIFVDTEGYEVLSIFRNASIDFVASQDCHLAKSDTGARGKGVDLSNDSVYPITTDIDGKIRTTWDLGADEGRDAYVAVCESTYWASPEWGGKGSEADRDAYYDARYDYLASWEVNRQRNLVTDGEIENVEIIGTWASADTQWFEIDTGWTVNSSCYVNIYTVGDARHSGVWSDTAYRLDTASQQDVGLDQSYTRFDGIQVKHNSTAAGGVAIHSSLWGGTGVVISNCLVVASAHDSSYAQGISIMSNYGSSIDVGYVYNCISVGFPRGMQSPSSDTSYMYFYNCLVKTGNGGNQWGYANDPDAPSFFYNCIAVDCSTDWTNTGSNVVIDYCASDSGTGTNATVLDSTNNYENEFVDYVNNDFRLQQTSVCIMSGTASVYDTVSTDIAGTSRGTSNADVFDIGAFHATEYTKTIMQSGGDYTGLDAWQNAEARDLVSINKIANAKIDGVWTASDDTDSDLDTWTTNPQNYINIYTTTTARHNGKWDYNAYRLVTSNPPIIIESGHTRIDGLQLKATSAVDYSSSLATGAGSYGVESASCEHYISNNIITRDTAPGQDYIYGIRLIWFAAGNYSTYKIWNNIIYDVISDTGTNAYGIDVGAADMKGYIVNNTIYNCYDGIDLNTNSNTMECFNNLIASCDNICLDPGGSASCDYNITTDATATGNHSLSSVELASIDFVDRANRDLHIGANSVAHKAGLDLSSLDIFQKDIDGSWR